MAVQFPDALSDKEIPVEVKKDPTSKKDIPDDDTKQFFNGIFNMAKDARQPREAVWRKAWDLYNGDYDWSAKADWQSKTNIPKVRDAVDRAAASFRRALVRIKRFYGIESETKLGVQKGLFTISLMDFWLDRANFTHEFTTGLKAGLITSSIIFKVWWNFEIQDSIDIEETQVEKPVRAEGVVVGTRTEQKSTIKRGQKVVGKLGLKAVDPFKFWIIPGSNGKSCIERTESSMADITALANKGVYSKAALKELRDGRAKESLEDAESKRREGMNPSRQTPFGKPVELFHYWGDIYNADGEVLMRNATFTMAGKDIVLRKPRANPFLHGKPPYVWGTPYIVPFSTYNRGLVEDIIGIAEMITELSNLIVDGAHFDAIRAFQVDVDSLYNEREVSEGIYPGKTLRFKGTENPLGKQVVQPIEVGQVPASVLGVLEYLDKEYQISTAVTELISGAPSSKGARTATEITSKSAQAQEGLDDAARTVEETVINPLLEKVAQVMYQYHEDYQMPRLVEQFPETAQVLQSLSPEERYVAMVGGFQFKAKGISIMLDRAQSLEKIAGFLQMVSALPGVLQRLNIDAMLEEIVVSLGWNPQKMLVQATPAVTAANEQPEQSPEAGLPGAATQTPAQVSAGQQGAAQGGSMNNPQANPPLQ